MPRLIDKPITVTLIMDPAFGELRPASFTWRSSRFRVARVLEQWEESGLTWLKPGLKCRIRYRVTPSGLIREPLFDGWVLAAAA